MTHTSQTASFPKPLASVLTERDAADFLGVSIRTMQNWRHRGGGPRYSKLNNRAVRYRIAELEKWLDDQSVSNTSEAYDRFGC